jgi:hypothetical protein
MSNEPEQSEHEPLSYLLVRYWLVWVFSGIIPAAILIFLFGAGISSTKPTNVVSRATAEEDNLRDARATLARDPDLATFRASLGRINTYLSEHNEQRAPTVAAEAQARMAERFGLDEGELAESTHNSYSALDGRYLDECLLFRDAARGLDAEESTSEGKVLHPEALDRALAAFHWVVRQVRPINQDPEALLNPDQEQLPPAFTLRRGWGDPLERALVFLALLQQDSGPERLRGCLLTVPGKAKGSPRLWACGVVVGDENKVYLFDPRLGLPLPGAGGKGVATLEAAIKDPAVLAQIDAGPDNRYDVKAEQARAADGLVVFSLSALAPRTRHLQETLLKNSLGARLAADTADVDRVREAIKASGGAGASLWKPGIGLLRRFLPPAEGGVDAGEKVLLSDLPGFTTRGDRSAIMMTRLARFEWALVPWELMPQQFNPRDFPVNVGLGQRVREYFASLFTSPIRDPRSSRELLLHGRYNQAVPKLVNEDNELREALARRLQRPGLDQEIAEWLKAARDVYADKQRAQKAGDSVAAASADKRIAALWKAADPVYILLVGGASLPRDGEVTYQLGLCKHEQAEQYQARLDLLARAGVAPAAADVERCKQTWADAKDWWDRTAAEFGRGSAAPPARQNRGRAEAMLGDWSAAAATWGDVSGYMGPADKLAALYRAREAQKHTAPKK